MLAITVMASTLTAAWSLFHGTLYPFSGSSVGPSSDWDHHYCFCHSFPDPRRPGNSHTRVVRDPENVARLNAQLGLDRPLVQRYFIWLGNLLQGDLGRSFSLNRLVIDEILERFNATLILSGLAFVMCSVLGILAGVISATRQYGLADKLITFSVLVGISVPSFFSA